MRVALQIVVQPAAWCPSIRSENSGANDVGKHLLDQIFTALQFVNSGRYVSVPYKKRKDRPYDVFFHVYKPVTKFKKSNPPEPDFRIAVIE